ncbi:CydD: thiol reductant ABC exporter, CydD subunit (plasmid) [Rubrobacter radiotolerans]|uniref:CydD: thiol reductant ABC exporter, CydD subunit n=1 Tax=Rubrobacter radiotolerans TaxID=42256 RepID=A0A023X7N4_RUBRA|nr:thiol reductant ABC exporter subunit CydD [Rubrobacter radiotolerans]AHY48353.1 CydD: thiol reductant ABC exporter, CydD subunit [Rubrobacter radiotolerans]MDX5895490.1 thiol reductant ABC exporter subunit CydD [Rubrobacter radiotolerans]SMC01551.1 ATP-binding cassette, subfamily C, CydD [Rubrobacter radiotolerans DSM 5868]
MKNGERGGDDRAERSAERRAGRELVGRVGGTRAYLAASVAFGALGTVATVVQLAALAAVVGAVFLRAEEPGEVVRVVLVFVGATLARAGFAWLRGAAGSRGAARAKSVLRERTFRRLLARGPAYTGKERTGELVASLTEGVEKLDDYLRRYLPQKYLCALSPGIIAAYVFTKDVPSALLLLVTAPVIPVMMAVVGAYSEEHVKSRMASLGRTSAYFLDVIQGLPTLRAAARSRSEGERVGRVSESFRRRTMKVLRYAFLSGLVLEFMTALAIGLVAVVLGVRVISGSVPFEAALVVLLLAPEFYRPLRELGASRHAGIEGEAAAERLLELLDGGSPDEKPAGRDTLAGEPFYARRSGAVPSPAASLTLRGVRYTYPGAERPALCGVDLEVSPGEVVAVVGPSGAGKSTLIQAVMRFIEPDAGEISLGGVPARNLPPNLWRERLAFVPQRPHVFSGTLGENLLLARPEATEEELARAVRLAGLDELLERLPLGYDTPVGERGARLSGGEAQRVAIARAFLKDAPLLVLDEPTANLDPENERLVRDSLELLTRERTALVVAHRLSTVRRADRTLVLDGGRVAERGEHEALAGGDGLYARLLESYRGEAWPDGPTNGLRRAFG